MHTSDKISDCHIFLLDKHLKFCVMFEGSEIKPQQFQHCFSLTRALVQPTDPCSTAPSFFPGAQPRAAPSSQPAQPTAARSSPAASQHISLRNTTYKGHRFREVTQRGRKGTEAVWYSYRKLNVILPRLQSWAAKASDSFDTAAAELF